MVNNHRTTVRTRVTGRRFGAWLPSVICTGSNICRLKSGQSRICPVSLVGVVFPGRCKKIQTELVIPQSDLTWLESGANQHGPKIAFVVIHFVIVDLYFRTESEPECRQLEESLPTPRRDIHQEQPRASKQTPSRLDDKLRLSHVFQYRDEHDAVHAFASSFGNVCSIVP